jgi:hypothetical protein
MYAKITLAAFAVVLTAVSVNGTAFAKSKIPFDARTSQGRAYDRAFAGAYGAAPGYLSQNRVYAPNQYRPGQVFGAGVDPDFQLQRSN